MKNPAHAPTLTLPIVLLIGAGCASGTSESASPERPLHAGLEASLTDYLQDAVESHGLAGATLAVAFLDDPLTRWLGEEEWLGRVPNAANVSLRDLLRHRSGMPE